MHASIEQLIGLRDGEPVAVELQDHVRGCDRCARVLNGLVTLTDGLRDVADPEVPSGVWQRVLDQVDRSDVEHDSPRWMPALGVALVASIVGTLLLVRVPATLPGPDASSATTAVPAPAPGLGDLMAQSRYLERAVLSLNDSADRMVVSAGTASTVATLEDRIAVVDYEINHAPSRSGRELEKLWQQRVNLLQSLAAVRYAQVAGNSI